MPPICSSLLLSARSLSCRSGPLTRRCCLTKCSTAALGVSSSSALLAPNFWVLCAMKVASSSPILRPSAVVASCPAYVSFDHGDLRPRALRRHDLEISTNRAAYNSRHEQALALAASSSAGTLAIWIAARLLLVLPFTQGGLPVLSKKDPMAQRIANVDAEFSIYSCFTCSLINPVDDENSSAHINNPIHTEIIANELELFI
uniref:Uncharacterized protein n=1 Tax=Saccharum officinarum TaxID=4547 RepID=A0A678TQE7_SACOF|nr:hypothetical protein SO29L03_000008 [Saccharum officinarum]